MKQNQFLFSLLLFIVVASFLTYIMYEPSEENFYRSLFFSCLGASAMFLIPIVAKKFNE